ncbi:MAG TPA: type I restriction endonuclease subunit R, partial [Atribacterota bacterium]|nr:type I restriction endonuclease subunit R [Atribacterota bacterium]
INDIDVSQRLQKELRRDYHIITAKKRLNQIAKDFVDHYTTSWEAGKAMLVCIDKLTCVRMYELIEQYWDKKAEEIREFQNMAAGEKREDLSNQLIWMKETKMAVIVSEEQGEL